MFFFSCMNEMLENNTLFSKYNTTMQKYPRVGLYIIYVETLT